MGGNDGSAQLPPLDGDHWIDRAACTCVDDPDTFFPDRNASGWSALGYCASCPVLLECRAHALRLPERFGVWGGLTEVQRERILRAERAAGAARPVRRPSTWVGAARRDTARSSDVVGA